MQTLAAAAGAGAEILVLCDTNGGTLPWEVAEIVRETKKNISTPLGIHTHNDSGTAVASSLMAVQEGCVQVQGTINGYGERCGNANLCTIISDLQLKMSYSCVTDEQLHHLTSVSRYVSELANMKHQKTFRLSEKVHLPIKAVFMSVP